MSYNLECEKYLYRKIWVKTSCQYDAKELFEPITNTVTAASESLLEHAKAAAKATEEINKNELGKTIALADSKKCLTNSKRNYANQVC